MLDVDYLVVGAGAMGMAFTDVLLTESDATIAIVDRRGRPGGHWNDSYPFVRLHQPSAFYGVNSRALGEDTIDAVGWNAGLFELASGTEVVSYFDQLMQQQFLPSGRVRYFPMSEYAGDRITSLIGGEEHQVRERKVVDATYMNVTVPSMQPPTYEVDDGVRCVPLNDLTKLDRSPAGYTIIGAGKTAMDACLWLLANEVDPAMITWIMPRDSWLLDRARLQPGAEAFARTADFVATQMEVIGRSSTIDELFEGLEESGSLLRLDPAVRPTMYRCATVTVAELEQLRRIDHIVRLGRVQRIEVDRIVLDEGEIPTTTEQLHVDCSADGLARRPETPIFSGDRLTLQTVRTCQQVFSAAFSAHVELSYADEATKNELCTVVPHPNTDIDWLSTTLANTSNAGRWRQDPDLTAWLAAARLDGFSGNNARDDPATTNILMRLRENTGPAMVRLEQLIEQA